MINKGHIYNKRYDNPPSFILIMYMSIMLNNTRLLSQPQTKRVYMKCVGFEDSP